MKEQLPTFPTFTQRQTELLELIDMGIPTKADLARAMKVSRPRISHILGRIEAQSPADIPEFDDIAKERRERKIVRMRFEDGHTWRKIAEFFGYKDVASPHHRARSYLGRPRMEQMSKDLRNRK